jgi:hypothetical protein
MTDKMPESAFTPAELAAMRELVKDLKADGWAVECSVVTGPDRIPVAVVARGPEDSPLRTFVAACRSLLRAAEKVREVNPALTAEEHETVQAARLTCRVMGERALVFGATLGTFAHAEMARAVRRHEDGEDRLPGTLGRLEGIQEDCAWVAAEFEPEEDKDE